jgi:hypothetical protein
MLLLFYCVVINFLLDKQKESGNNLINVLFLFLPQKEKESKRKVTAV